MKSIYILILITFSSVYLKAQTSHLPDHSRLDSTNRKSDSLLIEAMRHSFADHLNKGNSDSAYLAVRSLRDWALSHDDLALQAEALALLSRAHIMNGSYTEAIDALDSCRNLYLSIEDLPAWGYHARDIARRLAEQGRTTESLDLFQELTELYHDLRDTASWAHIIGNLGIVLSRSGDKSGAAEQYVKSLQLKRLLNDSLGMAMTLNSMGNLFQDMSQLDRAEQYLKEGLELFVALDYTLGIGSALSNLGVVEQERGHLDKALEYYEQSLEAKRESGHLRGMVVSLINCASVAELQGDSEKALEWYREAEVLVDQGGMDTYRSGVEIGIANAWLELGDASGARRLALKAYRRAKKGGDLGKTMSAAKVLSEAEQALGKFQAALEYRLEFEIYKDSVDNRENMRKVMQQGFLYDFEKKHLADSLSFIKEREVLELNEALKRESLKRTRNIYMFSAAGVLLLALGLWRRVVFIGRAKQAIQKEKDRNEELLLNILPKQVAEELKEKGRSEAELIDPVTVLFTDFKGFTSLSEMVTPRDLVKDLHECFSAFDRICDKYGIEKIKTIGDAYMAAGGLPIPNTTHAKDVVQATLEMRDFIEKGKKQKIASGLPYFEIRIGVHTGPVVAGIVGVKKFQYDIWGDTVNTANRMESNGVVGKVNISHTTYEILKDDPDFSFESRGKVDVKGKGATEMWFVNRSSVQ